MPDSDLMLLTGHTNAGMLSKYKRYDAQTQKEIYERYNDRVEDGVAVKV